MNPNDYVTTKQAVSLWEKTSGVKAVTNKSQLFVHHAGNGNFDKWSKELDPPLGKDEPAAFKAGRDWQIHRRLIIHYALHPPKPGGNPNNDTTAWNKEQIIGWIREENLQSRREMAKRLGVVPESISRYLDQLIGEDKITRDEKGQLAITA